jgi:phage recombination protein Bet
MDLALPTDGDSDHWTKQEHALVAAAGLYRTERDKSTVLADRPTVEAFLAHCRRTGLDPIARQIYAIYRGGKWGIQISIDGARLVAERSGKYEGQTPVQWTADGERWVDAWMSPEYPRAARVGVYKTGFREPLYAVARWESYVVMKDVWERGQKTGEQVVSDMWAKMPDLMLGKVAEMLALRKAFPQDLSGLYSGEEMAQADNGRQQPPAAQRAPQPAVATVIEAERDWQSEIDAAGTLDALTAVLNDAQAAGQLRAPCGDSNVYDYAVARRREIEAAAAPEPIVDVQPEREKPRDWVREARGKGDPESVRTLYREAEAAGAAPEVLQQIEAIEASFAGPSDAELAAETPMWAESTEPAADWNVAQIPAEAPGEATAADEEPF